MEFAHWRFGDVQMESKYWIPSLTTRFTFPIRPIIVKGLVIKDDLKLNFNRVN